MRKQSFLTASSISAQEKRKGWTSSQGQGAGGEEWGKMTMITLREFVDLAVDDIYDCYIYDNEEKNNVFKGMLCDIPDDLLDAVVSSWEFDDCGIGININ